MSKTEESLPKRRSETAPGTLVRRRRAAAGQIDLRAIYQTLSMHQYGTQINYDISYVSDIVDLHTHNFYEILFICRGQDVQYLLDHKRYQLQKGDIMLIPPGMPHRPLFLQELSEPYERYAMWIDANFFEGFLPLFPELNYALNQCELADSGLLRSNPASYSTLYEAFHSLWTEQQEKRFGWQASVALGGIQLMAQISRTFYDRATAVAQTESRNLFDEALDYIDRNLSCKLSLDSISSELHVSKSTISHLFLQQMNVSFYHCVIQRRLIAAKNLILEGRPLCDIWESCGFADYSSFYRLFKKEYGMSPKEFRSNQKSTFEPL